MNIVLIPMEAKDKELALHLAPEEMLDRLNLPYYYAILAVDKEDNTPAGILIYCLARGKRLDIEWLNVYEDYRFKGIGDELMEMAFALAMEAKYPYVGVRLAGEMETPKNRESMRNYLMDFGGDMGVSVNGDWVITEEDLKNAPALTQNVRSSKAFPAGGVPSKQILNYIKLHEENLKTAPLYDPDKVVDSFDPVTSTICFQNKEIKGILLVLRQKETVYPLALEYEGEEKTLHQLLCGMIRDLEMICTEEKIPKEDLRLCVMGSQKASDLITELFPEKAAEKAFLFTAAASAAVNRITPTPVDPFARREPEEYRWLKNEYFGDVE